MPPTLPLKYIRNHTSQNRLLVIHLLTECAVCAESLAHVILRMQPKTCVLCGAGMQLLANLTGLECLHVACTDTIHDSGLAHLTSLTNLAELILHSKTLEPEVRSPKPPALHCSQPCLHVPMPSYDCTTGVLAFDALIAAISSCHCLGQNPHALISVLSVTRLWNQTSFGERLMH